MHGITIFSLLHIPEQLVPVAATIIVFIIAGFIALGIRKAYKKPDGYIPSSKINAANIAELIVEGMGGFFESILGNHAKEFTPLLLATFIYILIGNLIGLIPGFTGPTGNMNTNAAMGLFMFLYYNYVGLKKHGIHYLKVFVGPMVALALFMIPIELMTHLARPLSLTLRLTGNMGGEHLVMGIISGMVPLVIPIVFLFLGLLTSIIQAVVFTALSAIYLLLSIDIDH